LRGWRPPPDLVIVDLDGVEDAERDLFFATWNDPALRHVPIVVLDKPVSPLEHSRLGSARLAKPFTFEQLRALIASLPSVPARVVFLVDDDDGMRRLLRVALSHYGFKVLTAAGGSEAVRHFGQLAGRVDVVLLDVHMPDLDGPSTLAELRRLDPDVVVLFMTGFVDKHEDLLALGAADVVMKPFQNLRELAQRVRELAIRKKR
jgi:CheY-like chemotaxis protein